MKNTEKMIAVMRNGKELEINTNQMFNNQYNTIEGTRIFDTEILHIINDKRIGLYCSSVKQGTYEEVLEAIKEHRSHIDCCLNCDGENKKCFWYQTKERIVNEQERKVRYENDREITDTVSHVEYSMYCQHKDKYNGKCVYDIDEEPKLFTEINDCFFVNYPNGVPDNSDFIQWLIDNHEETNIVPYWGDCTLQNAHTLKFNGKLGSYILAIRKSDICGTNFELSNSRDQACFAYDFDNNKFITVEGFSYKIMNCLYKQYSTKELVTCWDKFEKIWNNWVEGYKASL